MKVEEYENFNSLFNHYKMNYTGFLEIMISNLDKEERKKLNEILHTKTLIIKDQVKQRKIFKIKGIS